MATGLRVEDRMDGAANFSSWKARIVLLFQENELRDIVEGTTATLVVAIPTDATALAAFTKKDIKAKRILFDAVKDHIIVEISISKHSPRSEVISDHPEASQGDLEIN